MPEPTPDLARWAGLRGWNLRCNACGLWGANWTRIGGLRRSLALCESDMAALVAEVKRHEEAMRRLTEVRFPQPIPAPTMPSMAEDRRRRRAAEANRLAASASPSGDTGHTPDVAATVADSPVETSLAEIRTWLADDTPYCILPVRREHLPAVLARLDELEQQAAEMATRVEMPTGTEFVAKYFTPDLMSAVNETPAAPGAEDLFAVHPSPSVGKARERIADPAAYFERVRGAAEAALTAARAARARPSDGDPGLPLSALFDNRDPHQDEMRAGTDTDQHGPVYVKPDEELPHA